MPKVKHVIVKWARENAKLSVEQAARKLQLTDSKAMSATEKLIAYEEGEKEPSRSLLIRMSRLYHRPLLLFYLERPPNIGDRGEDFRTLPGDFAETEDAAVDALIRDIKARQSLVRETLIDEDEEVHLDFVGQLTVDDGVTRVADAIRQAIKFDLENYRNQPNYKEAFRYLRQQAEAAGIFVLLKGNLGSYHSNIAVTAFRGFALSDDIAPFIVINDRDAEAAWSFTLLHELAHIILGQTGISGAYGEKKIEQFCNNVASEILLPNSEFNKFQILATNFEALTNSISDYAFLQKVSSSHITYRLYRRGDLDNPLWERLREFYRQKWLDQRRSTQERNAQTEGGPNYYVVKQYKLGALVNLVQRMADTGAITTTKAGMLLDVKPLKVHRLFEVGQSA